MESSYGLLHGIRKYSILRFFASWIDTCIIAMDIYTNMCRGSSSHDYSKMTLQQNTIKNPIVWIDLEMTGLDYEHDDIVEIAVIITDGDLQTMVEVTSNIGMQEEGLEFGFLR